MMFYEDQADYLAQLPEDWRELAEVDAIAGAVEIQLDKLAARLKQDTDNLSVSDADARGVSRWENILRVSAPLDGSLQARRDALRAKLMSRPPINEQGLKAVIEAYMGLPVELKKEDGFVLKVWYRGQSRQPDLNPLYATIYEMIPANLIVEIAYLWATWAEARAACPTWGAMRAKTWGEVKRG